MSRTENLAPLLDLPPATVELERAGGELVLRHTAGPAALGIVLEDARPYESPGWILFSDNAIDLLPGETRILRVEGEGPLLVESWNLKAQRVA